MHARVTKSTYAQCTKAQRTYAHTFRDIKRQRLFVCTCAQVHIRIRYTRNAQMHKRSTHIRIHFPRHKTAARVCKIVICVKTMPYIMQAREYAFMHVKDIHAGYFCIQNINFDRLTYSESNPIAICPDVANATHMAHRYTCPSPMYACAYVRMHVCMYVCMHMCTCVITCIHV